MVFVCQGRCKKIKETWYRRAGISFWDIGLVRCNVCDLFFKKEKAVHNKKCPCCGSYIRISTRGKKIFRKIDRRIRIE